MELNAHIKSFNNKYYILFLFVMYKKYIYLRNKPTYVQYCHRKIYSLS